MRGFELYQTWQHWVNQVPSLNEQNQGLIARALILTKGKLDEVEFVTGLSKNEIFKVYQLLSEKELLNSFDSKEEGVDKMNTTTLKRQGRTFTREEMIEYTKRKLLQANPDIQFRGIKYNVLTCEYKGDTFKIYISSSRDYEFMRKESELDPYKVSAWNKGSHEIFTSCDYYALLVKADSNTKYITETEDDIEGLFVSQEELNQWFNQKVSVPSGMINCYVHFSQTPGQGRESIKVIDDREEPSIDLNNLFQMGWTFR